MHKLSLPRCFSEMMAKLRGTNMDGSRENWRANVSRLDLPFKNVYFITFYSLWCLHESRFLYSTIEMKAIAAFRTTAFERIVKLQRCTGSFVLDSWFPMLCYIIFLLQFSKTAETMPTIFYAIGMNYVTSVEQISTRLPLGSFFNADGFSLFVLCWTAYAVILTHTLRAVFNQPGCSTSRGSVLF